MWEEGGFSPQIFFDALSKKWHNFFLNFVFVTAQFQIWHLLHCIARPCLLLNFNVSRYVAMAFVYEL